MTHELTVIPVRDYTSPGDRDSAPGILEAIKAARRCGQKTIQFDSGRYILRSSIDLVTEGIIHDADSGGAAPLKAVHLPVNGIADLTLLGTGDANGEPATTLVGWNDGERHSFLPSILWCENSPRLTLRNIAFTREPAFAAAGTIIARDAEHITVRVLPDCPSWDGMGVYCANRFDASGQTLLGESVTYGKGADALWRETGASQLTLHSAAVAAKVNVGELLSWHQGAQTDFQVYFGHCDDLHLQNLRTCNSNGFCFLTESCRNITASRIIFRPDGNRLFTGPRDAWKIFKCGGNIAIDALSIQGVRMDGQNMHSNWLRLRKKISDTEIIAHAKYTYAPILSGSLIEFYNGTQIQTCMVYEAYAEGKADNGNLYRIKLSQPIPDFASEGTLCAALCWEADAYRCHNSDFLNIAGSGHLCRYDNISLINNRYRNTLRRRTLHRRAD